MHPRVLETFPTGALHDAWSNTPPRKARLTLEERRTHALLGGARVRTQTSEKADKRSLRRAR